MTYIQFQPLENSAGKKTAVTANNFEDCKAFLKSFSADTDFSIYESKKQEDSKEEIPISKVIRKLKIQTVIPANKLGKSSYLEFTAKDAEDATIEYSGIICWD